MDLIDLKVDTRTKTGNGPARELRRQGKVPAVLYGRETAPVLLSVGSKAIETVLKEGPSAQLLLRLDVQGGGGPNVMIKELQTHPLSREFLHVDFYEVDMLRKIRVNVPVVTVGLAAGVEEGGTLQIVRRELAVLCLPTNIPESIEVDVTELQIGDAIHVEEIALPGDVEIPTDVNFTVLTVLSPMMEEEEPEAEEGEEGEEEIGDGDESADDTEDEEA